MVTMVRVQPAWRSRGIGGALLRALFAHPRARHTLAALKEGGHREDEGANAGLSTGQLRELTLVNPRFFGAAGFRPCPLLHAELLLRPADAAHPARARPAETPAEVFERFGREEQLQRMRDVRRAGLMRRGASEQQLRRELAEVEVKARLILGGALAKAALDADLASLNENWPRAVAAVRAKGLPELHLLNLKPGRAATLLKEDGALNFHLVAYDVLGVLDEKEAKEVGLGPGHCHPAKFKPEGGQCAVV